MRLIICLLLLIGGAARAATVLVASYGDGTASLTNATSAYNAASTGDTIQFPLNGSGTWSSSLTIGKQLTIDGNGTTLTAGTALAHGFFYTTGFTSSFLMRITGFTFNCVDLSSNGHALYFDAITLTNLRVDHNTFKHGDIQVEIGGCMGVFDHNIHYNAFSGFYPSAGTRTQADASWVDMSAGTGNALFFEDNIFIHDANWLGSDDNNSWFDTNNGGKFVFRYNYFVAKRVSSTVPAGNWPLVGTTVTAIPVTWVSTLGVIELHGSAAGGAAIAYWQADAAARRGQSVVEIYNNTVDGYRADFLCKLRGSANLVHDNVLDTTQFNPRVLLYEEEWYVTPQWNPLRVLWPAEDQVHNSFFWSNTLRLNGTPNASYVDAGTSAAVFIQQDRDYFLHAPQSSGGKESFTGANGASGTDPTDGSPYATVGTMTFSSSGANAYYGYAPYAYPHPLQGSTLSASSVITGTLTIQ